MLANYHSIALRTRAAHPCRARTRSVSSATTPAARRCHQASCRATLAASIPAMMPCIWWMLCVNCIPTEQAARSGSVARFYLQLPALAFTAAARVGRAVHAQHRQVTTHLRVRDGCLRHDRTCRVAAELAGHAPQVRCALLQRVRRVEGRLHADLLQLAPAAAVLRLTCFTINLAISNNATVRRLPQQASMPLCARVFVERLDGSIY